MQAFPDQDKLLGAVATIKPELKEPLFQAISDLMKARSSPREQTAAAPPLELPLSKSLTVASEDRGATFAIVGRWKLQELIGAGGSGLVVHARDKQLGAVAIKVIVPKQGSAFTAKETTRLEREAAAMQRARHYNVCVCHEWFIPGSGSMCVMVLEYLNGDSLEELLGQRGGPLSEVEVLRIAMACLDGLKAVHGCGLIHRDIKPQNIMTHELPDGGIVYKIIDFGIAMASDEDGDGGSTIATMMKTSGIRGIGTLHYMSTEQYSGENVTALTDIFSLGVTMFYLLSGRVPFGDGETNLRKIQNAVLGIAEAPDLRDIMGHEVTQVGAKVAEAVARALRKEPVERFQSAAEMLESLEVAMVRRGYALYDCMISYRVKSDARSALKLFEMLSRQQIELPGGATRRMRVYLDKFRLEDGERWDLGFVLDGVAASTVVVPLVSDGVTGADCGFASLAAADRLDCLLLEWELVLALEEAGRIAKVYPLLLGKPLPSGGGRSDFFEDGSSGGDAVPDACSEATFAETAKFLNQIDSSLVPARRSVRATRDGILKFQGLNLATLEPFHGCDAAESEMNEAEILEEAAKWVVVVVGGAVLNAMRAGSTRSSEPEPEMAVDAIVALRQELFTLKPSELLLRARTWGIPQETLDAAGDAGDPKAALVDLVFAVETEEPEEPDVVVPAAASPQGKTTTVEGWFQRLRQEGAAVAMAELGAEEPADLLDLEPEDIAAIAVALPKLKANQFKRFIEEARV
eukprot:SAG11_NODE_1634_length_4542_cov_2.175332_2_plen_748_part_00